MNVKGILEEFLKKNGTKCYVFCRDGAGQVKNAIISERKAYINCDEAGLRDQTEYVFLFCSSGNFAEKLRNAGRLIANGQSFLIVGLKTENFMGEMLYIKAICRKEGCL